MLGTSIIFSSSTATPGTPRASLLIVLMVHQDSPGVSPHGGANVRRGVSLCIPISFPVDSPATTENEISRGATERRGLSVDLAIECIVAFRRWRRRRRQYDGLVRRVPAAGSSNALLVHRLPLLPLTVTWAFSPIDDKVPNGSRTNPQIQRIPEQRTWDICRIYRKREREREWVSEWVREMFRYAYLFRW